MAGVEHDEIAVAGMGRGEGGCAGQCSEPEEYHFVVLEEAEQGWRPVELAVEEGEGGAGEAAAPGFADEGGAEEAPGVIRGKAKEDLIEEHVRQHRRRRRRRHGGWRRRIWM